MTETGRKINYSNMGAMLAVSLCGIVVGLLNSVDVMLEWVHATEVKEKELAAFEAKEQSVT